jgi:uncharacterized membrane protein YdjX (TVP38/TMEM64 family)
MLPDRLFRSPEARRDAIRRGLVAIALLVGVGVALAHFAPALLDPTVIRARLASLGPLAPAAFLLVQTLQVVVAPIPGQMLGGVGGYLFGTAIGTLLSLAGVITGSAIAFLASHRYGRPYVERTIDPDALARWDDFVARAGVPGLFLLFLLPTFPDDLLCFVAGVSEVRFRTFLLLVAVGRAPSFVAAAYAGSRTAAGAPVQAGLVVSGLLVVSLVVYLLSDRLLAGLEGAG